MSMMAGIRSNYHLFGWRGLWLVACARLLGKQPVIQVRTAGIAHPIHLRLRTTDASVFEEVILNSEYALQPGLRPPRVIIDAGANIGLSAVFFANRYPDARVIAIEPEASNFEMLLRNAVYYPNIVPLKAALWSEDADIDLSDPGTGKWGFRIHTGAGSNSGHGTTRGLTMNSIIANHQVDQIDILKVDIEGAEKEVFEQSQDWIGRVDVLMVELHDRFKDGCEKSVRAATAGFFHHWQKGETLFFTGSDRPCQESSGAFKNGFQICLNHAPDSAGVIR